MATLGSTVGGTTPGPLAGTSPESEVRRPFSRDPPSPAPQARGALAQARPGEESHPGWVRAAGRRAEEGTWGPRGRCRVRRLRPASLSPACPAGSCPLAAALSALEGEG